MRANARLAKLEAAANASQAHTMDFWDRVALFGRIDRWLDASGFLDELAAIESSVSIPTEMLDDVREYAVHCKRRRAFAKFEAGDPLTDDDMEALTSQP